MEVISRKHALEQGLTRYYTGKICRYGHDSERFTSSRACVQCSRERSKSARPDGKTFDPNAVKSNSVALPAMTDVELGDGSAVKWTVTGVNAHDLTKSEQVDHIKKLGLVGSSAQWALGDHWNSFKGSESERKQVFEAAGFQARTIYQYGLVCKRFTDDLRHPDLTYTHHRMIWLADRFHDDTATINAIDHIALNKMTVRQTQQWLNKGRVTATRVAVRKIGPVLKDCAKWIDTLDIVPAELLEAIEVIKKIKAELLS